MSLPDQITIPESIGKGDYIHRPPNHGPCCAVGHAMIELTGQPFRRKCDEVEGWNDFESAYRIAYRQACREDLIPEHERESHLLSVEVLNDSIFDGDVRTLIYLAAWCFLGIEGDCMPKDAYELSQRAKGATP